VLQAHSRPEGGCTLQVRQRATGQMLTLKPRWLVNCSGAGPVPRADLAGLADEADLADRSGRTELAEHEHGAGSAGHADTADSADDPDSNALWRSLLQQGQVRVDTHGLGIEVDDQHRIVMADGRVHPRWHYVGPLLRGQHWEATAVPELRLHAQRLAACLLAAD